jgi:uncharacterized lipoprotein YbaY/heat shock protein HslJ
MTLRSRAFLIGSLALAGAIASAQEARIIGTVAYRERVALPPTAAIEVTLEDVSRADAPASAIATTMAPTSGRQVPIKFEIAYDAASIDPRRRYAVRARITDGERVLFRSAQVPVLTQGHGTQAAIMLTAVPGQKPAPATGGGGAAPIVAAGQPQQNYLTNLPATFSGTLPCADCPGIRYQLNLFPDDSFFVRAISIDRPGQHDDLGTWAMSSDRRILILKGASETPQYFAVRDGRTLRQLDVEGRDLASKASLDLRRTPAFQPVDVKTSMTGSYRSTADGPRFVECSTGQSWPVADDGESAALESAYRNAKKRPGEPIIVAIDGHVTFTSKAETDASQPSVVVERIGKVTPAGTCPARFTPATLEKTNWKLTTLGGQTVPPAANAKQEPTLTFEADTGQFSGTGGCNRFIGTYQVSGTAMALTNAGTMMACPGAMANEAAFSATLRNTRSYRILGRQLELYGDDGKVLARFEAK